MIFFTVFSKLIVLAKRREPFQHFYQTFLTLEATAEMQQAGKILTKSHFVKKREKNRRMKNCSCFAKQFHSQKFCFHAEN